MIRLRRGRRAVGFLFFVLVMLPVLLGALGLAADVGRIIIANRQAADSADTIALAGAHAFESNANGSSASATLNVSNASSVARATFTEATGGGGRYPSMMPMLENAELSRVEVNQDATEVSVTISYQLTGFVAVDFLAGKRNQLSFAVTRTAAICSSGNSQFCAYPLP